MTRDTIAAAPAFRIRRGTLPADAMLSSRKKSLRSISVKRSRKARQPCHYPGRVYNAARIARENEGNGSVNSPFRDPAVSFDLAERSRGCEKGENLCELLKIPYPIIERLYRRDKRRIDRSMFAKARSHAPSDLSEAEVCRFSDEISSRLRHWKFAFAVQRLPYNDRMIAAHAIISHVYRITVGNRSRRTEAAAAAGSCFRSSRRNRLEAKNRLPLDRLFDFTLVLPVTHISNRQSPRSSRTAFARSRATHLVLTLLGGAGRLQGSSRSHWLRRNTSSSPMKSMKDGPPHVEARVGPADAVSGQLQLIWNGEVLVKLLTQREIICTSIERRSP